MCEIQGTFTAGKARKRNGKTLIQIRAFNISGRKKERRKK